MPQTTKTQQSSLTSEQQAAEERDRVAVERADREQEARQARREANEQAYQKSIEGEELPPSVVAAQGEAKQREEQDRRDAEIGKRDLEQTTEMIASQGKQGS